MLYKWHSGWWDDACLRTAYSSTHGTATRALLRQSCCRTEGQKSEGARRNESQDSTADTVQCEVALVRRTENLRGRAGGAEEMLGFASLCTETRLEPCESETSRVGCSWRTHRYLLYCHEQSRRGPLCLWVSVYWLRSRRAIDHIKLISSKTQLQHENHSLLVARVLEKYRNPLTGENNMWDGWNQLLQLHVLENF